MDINNIDDLPIIKHILAKLAANTDMIFDLHRDFNTLAAYETGDMNQLKRHEQQIKDQEQRLRALERRHTNPQRATYTPEKISHKFQIDLLNNFINVLYPDIISFNQLAFSGFDIIGKKLGNLIGNGDVYFYLDEIRFECICSGCVKSDDSEYECNVCGNVGDNLASVVHKIDCIYGAGDSFELANDTSTVVSAVYGSGSYICKACHKRFDSVELLSDHHNSEHTVMSATGNKIRGIKSDKPIVLINDDPDANTAEEIPDKMRFVFGDTIDLRQYNHELHDAYHDKLFEIEKLSNDDILLDHYKKYIKLACEFCSDDPVGIKNSPGANKVISIEFSDLDCGICENEVVSPDNFSIIDNEVFHFDCVIEARNIAGGKIPGKMHPTTDDMHKVHLLVNGVVEGGYCGIEVTTPNSYFTSNLDHGLASFQEWCVDCLLAYIKGNNQNNTGVEK